jgi:hypothetical protein
MDGRQTLPQDFSISSLMTSLLFQGPVVSLVGEVLLSVGNLLSADLRDFNGSLLDISGGLRSLGEAPKLPLLASGRRRCRLLDRADRRARDGHAGAGAVGRRYRYDQVYCRVSGSSRVGRCSAQRIRPLSNDKVLVLRDLIVRA